MSEHLSSAGAFETSIEDCVAVVIDPDHPRFGETARIDYHDWQGSGAVGITFPDGVEDNLYDGGSFDGSPQVRILRKDDTEAIDSLKGSLQ